MNNNKTNYEFVDRDYNSIVKGNEKKRFNSTLEHLMLSIININFGVITN